MTTSTGSVPPPNPLSYTGDVVVPYINKTFDPQNTFNTFSVPTVWVNTASGNAWMLTRKPNGVADWVPIGGSPGQVETITTPDSTVVVPTANNINFVNGTGMNITGSGSSITFATTGAVVILITANSGTATPSSGNLNVLGGTTGLTTTASGNTVNLTGTLNVANGGTGNTTFTAYSVICAGTTATGTFQNVSGVGSLGQVLTSQGAGSLPIWSSNAGGNVTGPGTSTNRAIATWNGTAGDALFDNPSATIDSSGRMTNTSQPAFLAYMGAADNNVTGAGALYTLGTVTAMTEHFDQGNNFNTNGTFTAPITGKYMLSVQFTVGNLTAAMTNITCNLRTSNTVFPFGYINPGAVRSLIVTPDAYSCNCTVLADMDVGDIFTAETGISGGAGNTASVDGTGSARVFMSGALIC